VETEIFQMMNFFPLFLDLSLDLDKNFVPEISLICIVRNHTHSLSPLRNL